MIKICLQIEHTYVKTPGPVNSIFSYPPILALESLLHIGFETKSM